MNILIYCCCDMDFWKDHNKKFIKIVTDQNEKLIKIIMNQNEKLIKIVKDQNQKNYYGTKSKGWTSGRSNEKGSKRNVFFILPVNYDFGSIWSYK